MNNLGWNDDNYDYSQEFKNYSGFDNNYGPRGSGSWRGSGNWRGSKRGGWQDYGQCRNNWGYPNMWGQQGNWGPPSQSQNWDTAGGENPSGFWRPAQQNSKIQNNESRADFGWGKGFGLDGPPMAAIDVATRHLLRCKIAKDYIKNLPREILKLFGPNRCGLCDISFDSFATSRGHYQSKAHYKVQKRSVANKVNKVNDGFKRPNKKECPLLPRDKYCELCDVQITSDAHADSHYAGRSHRAIVIGNKGPKNEALLRKDMSGRIAKLINREKTFLDTVEVQNPDDQAPPKDYPSELYCVICKTFVTCSEQMRMHLNGKRHLSKEKQHILKMMTAPTAKDKATPAEQAENEVAEAESQAEAGDNEDEFDWGNGSEAWEEDQANKQQQTINDPIIEN